MEKTSDPETPIGSEEQPTPQTRCWGRVVVGRHSPAVPPPRDLPSLLLTTIPCPHTVSSLSDQDNRLLCSWQPLWQVWRPFLDPPSLVVCDDQMRWRASGTGVEVAGWPQCRHCLPHRRCFTVLLHGDSHVSAATDSCGRHAHSRGQEEKKK